MLDRARACDSIGKIIARVTSTDPVDSVIAASAQERKKDPMTWDLASPI